MATILNPPPSNNAISVFAYEGFNFVISNPNPAVYSTLQPVSNTTGFGPSPAALYFTKTDNSFITFASSDLSNNLTAGTTESFKVTVTDASLNSLVSSNVVTIGAGRFLDAPGGASLSNNSYTFFKNETITPVQLVAPSFTLATPTSIPALPPGLSFSNVASNIFAIQGTPSVPVANLNYLVIGIQSGGSKIVTTRINIVISNERLRVDLSGSSIIGGMQIGTPIDARVITSVPPVTGGLVRYTYPTLPDGILVKDVNGNIPPFSGTTFIPTDPSYTMVIEGTPTLAAAETFRNAGATASGLPYTVGATRFVPLPTLSNTVPLTFQFGETVLFDTPSLDTFYVGVPVDMSRNFFRAQTYFTSNVGISNIFSPDLRSDLSLIYTPGSSRADLSGTPLTASTLSYTIRAINSNATQRDLAATIGVLNDSVTFVSPTPAVDTCYSFILSRPITSFKTGFYESNIQFKATAASALPVTLSAPALLGTGLSLDSSGVIVGLPTQVTPLTTLTVTANAVGSPGTATRDIQFSIVDDVFTFADVCSNALDFIQNVPSTPFQFQVTTLSERNIIGYSQSGFPSGLTINTAGIVSGTPTASAPTAGNVTINATTGYASGSRDFSYTLIPDAMIFTVPQTTYFYQAGDPVGSIDIDAVTFSGTSITSYDLSMVAPTYGLSLNSTTGVLSGTWTDSIPPNQLLPTMCNFSVNAQAGSLLGVLPAQFVANPTVSNVMLFVVNGENDLTNVDGTSWVYYTTPTDISSLNFMPFETGEFVSDPISELQLKNNDVTNNVILAPNPSSGAILYRSTNLGLLSEVSFSSNLFISSVANKPGTSTWWGVGRSASLSKASIVTSLDDGRTWNDSTVTAIADGPRELITRDSNGNQIVFSNTYRPYLENGVSVQYSAYADVLMAGGIGTYAMLRSADDGSNWSQVTGGFQEECAAYNLDVSSMWIATGSEGYQSISLAFGSGGGFTSATSTIKYSTDQGSNWSNATGGFNMFGYEVVYANNTWMATGVTATTPGVPTYSPELRFSTNGSNWTKIDLSTSPVFNPAFSFPIIAPLALGSVAFDGTFWNVFVNADAYGGIFNPAFNLGMYRHDTITPLTSGWTFVPLYESFDVPALNRPRLGAGLRFLSFKPPRYLYSGDPPINIQLAFQTTVGGGPTFTSPTITSYLQYQYVPITPIQVSATGTGQVYFFVEIADLPPGLQFNQRTGLITGTPAQIGNDSVTIYAKDDIGVSTFVLNFTTIIPRIIRRQDGAGAYTSLLRQYTEVLAAQSARDSRALPSEETLLGEFMSPVPAPVTTNPSNPNCDTC
jgi:hypothetical protein